MFGFNFISFFEQHTVGTEYQIDSVVRTNINNDHMSLNWSLNNTKKAIIFTDESMQSEFVNPIEIILQDCSLYDYSVSAFISTNVSDYNKWQAITLGCSGFLEYLSTNSDDMIEKLNYRFGEHC